MNDQFIQGVIFDWDKIDKDSYLKGIRSLPKYISNFPYFTGFSSLFISEMICIFPYFCPYEIIVREIRESFI